MWQLNGDVEDFNAEDQRNTVDLGSNNHKPKTTSACRLETLK